MMLGPFFKTGSQVTKPAHILLVGWGARDESEIPLKGLLASAPGCFYETAELTVLQPASDDDAGRISEAVARSSLDLLLLFISCDPVAREGASFFELARRNKWSVPIVAVCPTAKPKDVVEQLRRGSSAVLTLTLRSKKVVPR